MINIKKYGNMSVAKRFVIYHLSFVTILSGCVSTKAGPEPTKPTERTARLVFIGDVMSHEPQVTGAGADAREKNKAGENGARTGENSGNEMPAEYDYSEVFRAFEPIFAGADVVIANLETTLRTTPPYTGYPAFAAPARLAFDMQRAGIDIVTTANNHICDKGAAGIRSTLELLDSAGLRHTGAFLDSADRRARNPLRFSAGGLRFALLTYTYGTNGIPTPRGTMVNRIDTALIARDMAGIGRDSTDCVIVSYHWGDEYRALPNGVQKNLAAWTRARGADIVMGGHPHVVEPMEAHYNAEKSAVVGATFYSLGNFVSNQRRRYTDGGMTAEITVTRGGAKTGSETGSEADSLPLRYDLGYRLFWVYTPVRQGVMRYRAMPSATLDTMLSGSSHAAARAQYDLFMRDTRRLLSTVDSVFVEIK